MSPPRYLGPVVILVAGLHGFGCGGGNSGEAGTGGAGTTDRDAAAGPDAAVGTGEGAAGAAGDGGGGCVLCNDPPPNRCVDARTVRRFDAAGTCTGAGCDYPFHDELCTSGCTGGRCADDPCAGVACNTPPAPECADDMTLRLFDLGGTCDAGQCRYQSRTRTCSAGCAGGACLPELCEGVTCNTPPSLCHEPTGRCTNGTCTYDARPDGASCDDQDGCTTGDVCAQAVCRGSAIRCDTPPADECLDASTLRAYDRAGSCSNAACTYSHTDRTCAHGCNKGSCLQDPCSGVVCRTPAAPAECFANAGTCSNGTCSYAPLSGVSCDDGNPCTVSDACNSGSCAGTPKRCDSPPSPAACYKPAGTCSGGNCTYAYADGASCDDGDRCTHDDTCHSGVCAGQATCSGGDGCCPSGCTVMSDSDCDPLGSLVGKSLTGLATCGGMMYTRCDPYQYPSGSSCKGFWSVSATLAITINVTSGDGGAPQVTMVACRDTLDSSTCGQSNNSGHADFTSTDPGSFSADNVLVSQGDPYPFSGPMTVGVSASGMSLGYSGDTGWIVIPSGAGSIFERGHMGCSATLAVK